jgi:hypothetical protein
MIIDITKYLESFRKESINGLIKMFDINGMCTNLSFVMPVDDYDKLLEDKIVINCIQELSIGNECSVIIVIEGYTLYIIKEVVKCHSCNIDIQFYPCDLKRCPKSLTYKLDNEIKKK